MTEQEAKTLAEPTVKNIVDCMANGDYEHILEYAELENGITIDEFKKWANDYLDENDFSHYDEYDVPNNFHAQNYQQFCVYIYDDGSGFMVEYDLTTDSELNDLTLIMNFLYDNNKILKAYIHDLHVL